MHEALMAIALEEARLAGAEDCLPVGVVLTRGDEILARGRKSLTEVELGHGEMVVIREVFGRPHGLRRSDDIRLYTTLEPCLMCYGTIRHLPISTLVYAMEDPYGGCAALGDALLPPRHRDRPLTVRAAVCRDEAKRIFADFLCNTREPFWRAGGAPEFTSRVFGE